MYNASGALSDDNKMFAGRISDLIIGSEYSVRMSDFLTPLEQRMAYDTALSDGAASRCFFWGGVPDAERRVAVFLPEWMLPVDEAVGSAFDERRGEILREVMKNGADSGEIKQHIAAVEVVGSSFSVLEHRDYLGALLGLGIKRDVIGDISVVSENRAIIFVRRKTADYIISELSSVGKESVKVYGIELDDGFRIEREYECITDTVMSLRLDGMVRVLCRISREAASDLVEKGDVTLDYVVETRPDATVEKGDIISVRGYGKFVYDGDRGVNRRGRIRVDARKYK